MNERIKERAVVQTPVAIVGIACMFPRAPNLAEYWANVREGVDAITDVPSTHWDPTDYFDADPGTPDKTYGRRGGFLEPIDFDPMAFGISPRDIEATDTTQLLGMHVARQALEDAGYGDAGREFDRDRASVILGVTGTLPLVIPLGARLGHPIWRRALAEAGVDAETTEDVVARISDGYVPWQENSFPGLLGNVVAGRIANRLDLHGTNCVVDAACASSLSAVHLAVLELESGRSDMVLTGGLDTFNDPFMYMCFSKTPALSASGNARPFDQEGDGTILGEGVGMLVLKRLADAERDGDRIYAVIKGLGSSSDGKGKAVYAPDEEGQARALRAAYRMAGVRPDSIDLIEAHGTGTRVGDAVEIGGLTRVYRETAPDGTWCALGSVKSMIGHTKAAAGAAGLIKVAMALRSRTLPPTIKVERPNDAVAPEQTPFYVNTQKRPWLAPAEHPRRAGVSAFGFGGSNFHCVLEEYESERGAVDWDGRTQVLAFCGGDREAVLAALREFAADADWETVRGEAARARAAFDPRAEVRLLIVAERGGKPVRELLVGAERIVRGEVAHVASPQGIYFGVGEALGEVGLLFPGQGAQYVGMLRDLVCGFPQASEVLAQAESQTPGLVERVFPHPAFDDDARDEQAARLRATDVAQPAIGAVSLAALEVLRHFDVSGSAACGHSYGELTALCAAGRLTHAELHRLSRVRGRLMASGDGDRGSMLAVQAELGLVEAALAEHDLDLVLANRNAPRQAVLSGRTREIERAQTLLSEQGLRVKRLSVAAAFHSSLVAQAGAPFADSLAGVDLADAGVPVYANATGTAYPSRSTDARELLATQLTSPVEFVRCIESMYASGVRTFLEVGPGRRLCGLVDEILAGHEIATVAVDASAGRRSGDVDLARALAQLASLGHAVALARWDEGALERYERRLAAKKPVMTVRISGANHVNARPKRPARAPVSAPAPTSAAGVSSPPVTAPMSSQPVAPAPGANEQLLRASQEGLAALVRLQEQTAELHRRFLESQEQATRSIEALLASTLGTTLPAPRPVSVPAPAAALPVSDPLGVPAVAARPEPAPIPAPAPVVVATPALADTTVAPVLLEVVAEKTGYPVEMLELSMGLDADLGIDSIKRVEILSALQERLPDAPAIKPEHLGELQTLGQIAEFLGAQAGSKPLPTPTPTPASIPAPVPTLAPASDAIATALLAVVADKTGYPAEMLELSMGLDADLGIDSIKRVEILSALQERVPEAPAIKPEHLGELQTLGQIVEFLAGAPPTISTSTAAPPQAPPAAPRAAVAPASDAIADTLLAVVADKTGYPVEMLELSMGLDADLGIDSIKRVEILSALQERLPETPAVKPEHLGELHTLAHIVEFLSHGVSPAAPAVSPSVAVASVPVRASSTPGVLRLLPTLEPLLETGPALTLASRARVWVTDSGDALSGSIAAALRSRGLAVDEVGLRGGATPIPDDLAGLVLVAPERFEDAEVALAFARMRQLAGSLRRAGKRAAAVLVGVSRLGGGFGLDALREGAITSGALAGLIKTAAEEWPEVSCHAIDVDPSRVDADTLATHVLAQGPVEIGLRPDGPHTIALSPATTDAASDQHGVYFGGDDVVLITGGARGVTAEVAVALAEAGQPALVLVGRSPEPSAEPDWLIGLSTEPEIKRAIIQRASERLAPREVEAEYRRLAAAREILRNVARIEAAGSRVIYRSLDVREPEAVAAFVERVRTQLGPITGLVHGAGVLADRAIEDKSDEDFTRVYATKVDGLRALLAALASAPLRAMVLFSSSTARFGRRGQADYAAANEVLNKLAQREAVARPGCRVVSINWGPWDGGMVTPALRRVFSEEGITVIDVRAGASYLVDELASGSRAVEVVVLGDGSRVPTASPEPSRAPASAGEPPIAFERELSIASHPFLRAHVLDGRAVLPAVVTLEWLAHGALHGNPGLRFLGVDDLRVFKGVILDAQASLRVRVCAQPAEKRGDTFVVRAELRSGGNNGHAVLHARADVILAPRLPPAPAVQAMPATTPVARSVGDLYAAALFHGPMMQGLDRIDGRGERALVAHCRRADAPRDWMESPVRGRWIADPLALDCGMQAVIVWSYEGAGQVSLPARLGRYRQFVSGFPGEGTTIVVRVIDHDEHRAVADLDWLDAQGRLVARLEGYECVMDGSLLAAFGRNELGAAPRLHHH